jgi:hypothetical protein
MAKIPKAASLVRTALKLSTSDRVSFISSALRGLSNADRALVAKQSGVSSRTIEYALAAAQLSVRLRLSPEEMNFIGTTRLGLLGSAQREFTSKEQLFELCKVRPLAALRGLLKGTVLPVGIVAFELDAVQKKLLYSALLQFGAVSSGPNGLAGKNEALMKMVSRAVPARA